MRNTHTHTHTHFIITHMHTHTHTDVTDAISHKSFISVESYRRLSAQLQIIFHKRAIKYRSLLQKMTHKDKRSYESSPPSFHHLHDDVRIAFDKHFELCGMIAYVYVCVCVMLTCLSDTPYLKIFAGELD